MTPYELSILLHIWVTPTKFPDSHTTLYDNTIKKFKKDGIIGSINDQETIHGHELTPLGIAWLSVMLNTPKPTFVYIDHNGDVINIRQC